MTTEPEVLEAEGVYETKHITHPRAGHSIAMKHTYSPSELLQIAIVKKSDIATIERMSALVERLQKETIAREARIAFINAMVDAKAEMPLLTKNRHVAFAAKGEDGKSVDYWHEDLAEVVDKAQPVLAKHGLHFRWKLEQPAAGVVQVTCILEHRAGHFEETTITAGVDTSGKKNHIQAIKSAATYLERLTALASVGLAARSQDDDGRYGGVSQQPSGPVISDEQVTKLRDHLRLANRTEEQFCAWAKSAQVDISCIEELEEQYFESAIAKLKKIAKDNAK